MIGSSGARLSDAVPLMLGVGVGVLARSTPLAVTVAAAVATGPGPDARRVDGGRDEVRGGRRLAALQPKNCVW